MKRTDYGKPYWRAAFRDNRLTFAALMAVTILGAFLQLCIAVCLQLVTDTATGNGTWTIPQLILGCTALLAVIIGYDLLHREFASHFLRRANAQYRRELFSSLTEKSITAFSKEETGTYISMLTADANTVDTNYFEALEVIFDYTLQLVLSLILMFYYSWMLAIVSLGLTALVLISSMALGRKMERTERAVSDRSALFVAGVKDLLTGFGVIKSFQAEKECQRLYDEKNSQLEEARFCNRRLRYLAQILSGSASFIMQIGVFLLGAILANRGLITVGVIIAFVQLTGQVANAVANLSSRIGSFTAARGLMDKAGQALLENTDRRERQKLTAIGSGITGKDLHFGYDQENEVLKGVDLKIAPGKSYALVGASGSGKSTLLNLLLGSYPNYGGSVSVGGAELRDISAESMYDLISFVQQNVFVFDSTIEENITMFKSFPQAAIDDAIRRSGLSDLIREKGRDYRCGENGCNLSGGERQRISIARCLLKNTQVLMMDEATAALDAQTSANVTNAILDVNGLTRIIVTHKLEAAILDRFDEILVLRDGKIAEKGTFRQLLERNGYFGALYRVSAGT